MKILMIILIILGVLMVLAGAFLWCWPALAFLHPFFATTIAVGAIMSFSCIVTSGILWSDW